MKRSRTTFLIMGIFIGIVLGIGAGAWLSASRAAEAADNELKPSVHTGIKGGPEATRWNLAAAEMAAGRQEITGPCAQWDKDVVYVGGDAVVFENRIYRAKWWTQGERPSTADVWEASGQAVSSGTAVPSVKKPSAVNKPVAGGFKVVGYFPAWKPAQTAKLRWDVLTHVNYAFAIPTAEGGLRPLDGADTAKKIVSKAHENGVNVLLAVGGWSYNDVPLETAFMTATATEAKRAALVEAIVAMCGKYGFDGVDMDWEHPRVDGSSAVQYEAFMLLLADRLHSQGKLLTAAVLSGATADGNVYYDAAAHSDAVLRAVDWINVMAYDGGEGERHSPYEYAVNSARYWKDTRKLPPEKIVLGMPLYGRPSWASYEELLAADPGAWKKDQVQYNGMTVWFNGAATIQKKTKYAAENLGGVMVWEVTHDTTNEERSLMSAIRDALPQ